MAKSKVLDMVLVSGATAVAGGIAASGAQAQSLDGYYGGISYADIGGDYGLEFADYNFEGGSAGLFTGYNLSVGDMVLGVELAYVGSDITIEPSAYDYTFNNLIDISGRAGKVFGDVLVYGKAGVSFVGVETDFGYWDGNEIASGAHVGLGLDYVIADRYFVGADVTRRFMRYTDEVGQYVPSNQIDTASLRVGMRF